MQMIQNNLKQNCTVNSAWQYPENKLYLLPTFEKKVLPAHMEKTLNCKKSKKKLQVQRRYPLSQYAPKEQFKVE